MKEATLKRVLSADALGILLTCFTILILLYGMEATLRETQTRSLLPICLVAAGTGLCGGKSRWNGIPMSAAIAALGVIVVWILGAGVARHVLDLIGSLTVISPQVLPEIGFRFDADGRELMDSWNTILFSSTVLLSRWRTSLVGFAANLRLNDTLILNMLWTFALWLLSAWIGWFAAKRNAIASLVPATTLLTLITWSSERRVGALWALAVSMLLLMGIWNYRKHTKHWDTHRIDYSDSIRFDIAQTVLIVVMVAGFLAFVTPSISWRDVRDYWRELQNEHAQPSEVTDRSSGNNTDAVNPSGGTAPKAALPREHLLTGGSAQSTDIVMTVKTGELPPAMMESAAVRVPRYYWRNVIYDRYGSDGWYTTAARPQSVQANEPMIAGVLNGYKLIHLNVQMEQDEERLHWTGILFNADIPVTVDWRLRPQSGLFVDQSAALQADMFTVRTSAASYKADSFVPTPSIEQLRAAPVDVYPDHIRSHYFSLPDTVPARVHQLAQQITSGQATAYDKASAIETYLRLNYPYDLAISSPPEGRDVVDYFLFDLKRGYCDYYATAMVVLARSSGLPARFVSGYASGDYDALNARYVIRELHAHSWAEVYFPEIGWVEFEPTGSQPQIERQEALRQVITDDEAQSMGRDMFLELTNFKMAAVIIPLGIVIFLLIIHFTFVEPFLFLRSAPTVAIEVLYKRLYRSGRTLAGEPAPAETAYEFTNKLTQTIRSVNARLGNSSNELQKDVKDLAEIYQTSLFSNHYVERDDVRKALTIWKRLRRILIVERVKHFFWLRNKAH